MPTPTTTTFAAREAAIRRHYYQPSSSFLSASVPVATVFALVTPNSYTVQPPFPHSALHSQSAGLVGAGTEAGLVLVVFVVALGKRF